MRSGVAPAVSTGNPNTGVSTSGTTSASGGILGNDSFLGPPQAEHDKATGVLWRVHRGQAQPECCTIRTSTAPLFSGGCSVSFLERCCPCGSGGAAAVSVGAWGWTAAVGMLFALTAIGVIGVARDCSNPQTEQAPEPWELLRVHLGQAHRRSSVLLNRRIWLRSGFWRGASQMEQRGAAPAFRKVQRPHDHSLARTAAAMEPEE